MKNKNYVREMVMSGLFITMGIVLPVIFHLFGLGSTFLPMHIPVLLAGFMLDLPYAIAVGAITPFLSSIITGMPPLFPVMPYMVFELATYAAFASILSKRMKLNSYFTLIGSMIAGRIVAGVVVWALVILFGVKLPGPFVFVATAVTTGLPGIIVQLIAIPPMVIILKKTKVIRNEVFGIE
ncbi:MAG: ECF transporter S component [Acetivibrionales bacterium]